MAVPLPGGKGAWPQDVQVDGGAGVVLDRDGKPWILLAPGFHRIEGTYRWTQRPPGIPIPPVSLPISEDTISWDLANASLTAARTRS